MPRRRPKQLDDVAGWLAADLSRVTGEAWTVVEDASGQLQLVPARDEPSAHDRNRASCPPDRPRGRAEGRGGTR